MVGSHQAVLEVLSTQVLTMRVRVSHTVPLEIVLISGDRMSQRKTAPCGFVKINGVTVSAKRSMSPILNEDWKSLAFKV